jgi:bacillithiol system protein YtxJ
MNWNYLEHADQLNQIINESADTTILIFKHSTRCNISRATLDRLERNWKDAEVPNIKPYFLDLLSYRSAFQMPLPINFRLSINHHKFLLSVDGKSVYDNSHYGIDFSEIREKAKR